MKKSRLAWRRIAGAFFIVALAIIILLGAWRAVLHRGNGDRPSDSHLTPAPAATS